MRKALAPTLALTFLALGAAGIAWSGPSPVQAEPHMPLEAPEGDLEGNLLELFPEPVEATGACCYVDCMNERTACYEACPPWYTPEGQVSPEGQACRNQCYDQWLGCKSHC